MAKSRCHPSPVGAVALVALAGLVDLLPLALAADPVVDLLLVDPAVIWAAPEDLLLEADPLPVVQAGLAEAALHPSR
jgi:hypothetical protein